MCEGTSACDSPPLLKWTAFSWLYNEYTTGFKMKLLIWKGILVLAKLVVTWYTNTNLIILYLKTLVFCYFGILLEERKLIHLFTTKWINFQGNLKIFSSCCTYFCKNWQFLTMKSCHRWKSPTPLKFWKSPQWTWTVPLAHQTLLENPGYIYIYIYIYIYTYMYTFRVFH